MSIWDWNSVGNASQRTHSGLLVGLLDGVSGDVRVPGVLRCGPLQGHVEAPGVHDLRTGRGPGQLCRGQHGNHALKGAFRGLWRPLWRRRTAGRDVQKWVEE